MKLRFGYVSNALALHEASPARTMTFSTWSKLSEEERSEKLHTITETNLKSTLRALHYNIAHEIDLYRMSSSIVPLATHPEAKWDYITPFRYMFEEIGELVQKHRLRVSFHPNQFTLFTSPKQHVTDNAIGDLDYHVAMLDAMGLDSRSIVNIHIGGAYGDKEETLKRFYANFDSIPSHLRSHVTLENDDKTYNAKETLEACEQTGVPFIFDYHHHLANPGDGLPERFFERVHETWKPKGLLPKYHLSSPKSASAYRSHADYVDSEFAIPFIDMLKEYGEDADIMIEAKKKDLAALQLVDDLSAIRGVKRLSGGSVLWK
ncbi:UV DNA damage repair endonuclease UvsE [Alkalihalobacillus hwajinpoensis]|uniref:UV DNA damage repair endonuclease UvsE n=1 Tax=Guptibacillus hwajinpoensis TaxID=208199 RepID=UPI0018844E14|nr:UV DNA damage repair endonuclease UvsE [Pseudalkalibacillus hwajinpoensis]MBF0705207.1 UV DNA damage repair endonuclease UvsE [Pseudalkalibacillus hwajinpoensis]